MVEEIDDDDGVVVKRVSCTLFCYGSIDEIYS